MFKNLFSAKNKNQKPDSKSRKNSTNDIEKGKVNSPVKSTLKIDKKPVEEKPVEKTPAEPPSEKIPEPVPNPKITPAPKPAPKKYIRNSKIAILQEKIVGFDDESIVEIELPDGSTFWAKNFSVFSGDKETIDINFYLDGIARISTKYGNISFSGDSLRVKGGIVTEGLANNSIAIHSPEGVSVPLTYYLSFYWPGGNISRGYLSENLTINGIEYPKDAKVEFPEDGNLSYVKINGKQVQLKELQQYETSLFEAIKTNNPAGVKESLEKIHAAHTRYEDIKNSDNQIPLQVALSLGHMEIASLLIENGFSIDQNNAQGDSALHVFSAAGNIAIVQWLLDNRANVNIKDKKGRTPFSLALLAYRTDIVEMLLKAGADIAIRDDNDDHAIFDIIEDLTLVIEEKSRLEHACSLVRILVNAGMDVNMKNSAGESLFMKTCSAKYPELVELMLSHGTNINDRDAMENTPLHHAVTSGNIKITEILIAAGAEVNAVNREGETAISSAYENNQIELVKILVNGGADTSKLPQDAGLTFKDENINKRLQEAAYDGNSELIGALLKRGADVNVAESEMGYTPLMWASMKDYHNDSVQLLIEAGANLNARNSKGETALMVALRESGKLNAELLVEKGADFNIANNVGEIPIVIAAGYGYTNVVAKMIAMGADVNVKSRNGDTALSFARSSGYDDVVKLLLAHGAVN
jgi:ankyrin repeat protein